MQVKSLWILNMCFRKQTLSISTTYRHNMVTTASERYEGKFEAPSNLHVLQVLVLSLCHQSQFNRKFMHCRVWWQETEIMEQDVSDAKYGLLRSVQSAWVVRKFCGHSFLVDSVLIPLPHGGQNMFHMALGRKMQESCELCYGNRDSCNINCANEDKYRVAARMGVRLVGISGFINHWSGQTCRTKSDSDVSLLMMLRFKKK